MTGMMNIALGSVISQPFTAVDDSGDVNAAGAGATVTGGPCTATPVGGVAPYTYSWAKTTGDAITAVSSTSASTNFQATGMVSTEERQATFTCTVTDNVGTVVATRDITVTISRI